MAFNTIGKYHGVAFDVLQDNTRKFLAGIGVVTG